MAKILSTLLLVVLAPVFFVVLFLFSLKVTLFNPDFIKRELSDHNAYTIIYQNVPEILDAMAPKGGEGPDAAGPSDEQPILTTEEAVAFFYSTVSEQNLREKTESAIDSIWPWIFDGKELEPVSIQDIRSKLSDNILDIFRKRYEALPYCENPSDFDYDLKTCRPYGMSFDQILKEYQLQETGNADTPLDMAGDIPNEIDIQEMIDSGSDFEAQFAGFQSVKSVTSSIIGNTYLVLGALFIVIFCLSRLFAGSWKKTPIVLSIYTGLAALTLLVASISMTRFALPRLVDFSGERIQTLPTIKNQLLVPIIKDTLSDIGNTQMIISLVILGLGTALVLAMWAIINF